eukprot:5421619-Lingulodinium_polyedra.AAC.1
MHNTPAPALAQTPANLPGARGGERPQPLAPRTRSRPMCLGAATNTPAETRVGSPWASLPGPAYTAG